MLMSTANRSAYFAHSLTRKQLMCLDCRASQSRLAGPAKACQSACRLSDDLLKSELFWAWHELSRGRWAGGKRCTNNFSTEEGLSNSFALVIVAPQIPSQSVNRFFIGGELCRSQSPFCYKGMLPE